MEITNKDCYSGCIDIADGLNRVCGNEAVYKRMLQSFVSGTYIGKIKTAAHAGDVKEAASGAHALKGISANLSLAELYGLTVEIESELKNGIVCEESLDKLEASVTRTLNCINSLLNEA